MSSVLLTDAASFELDVESEAVLAAAGIEVRRLAGHGAAEVVAAAEGAAGILVYHAELSRSVIERLLGCRVIARCGAGWDKIDVVAAREAGIEVVYVPDYGVDEVADHTFALLLACARRVLQSDEAVRCGRWPAYADLGAMRRLRGRTLGLLGLGRIARAVGARALGFGLELIAHDPYAPPEAFGAARATRVGFAELVSGADFLSLHVPLGPQTRHLIGKAELRRMKHGAVLLNTSRGGLVEETALIDALSRGHLAAAGLDVYEHEPLSVDSPLLQQRSVVVTPHSAAFSEEALVEVSRRAVADMVRVLSGVPPRDPVPEQGSARR